MPVFWDCELIWNLSVMDKVTPVGHKTAGKPVGMF